MPVGAMDGLNINVGVNLQQFNSGMAQVEQRGQQAASALSKVGNALTTGAGMGAGFAAMNTALSGITSMAGAAGSAIVGLNSQLEQARIGFTAFTGSVEKSNQFVKQLQQFAATTTFEFPGLLQMSRSLTGMGVAAESVIPMLQKVGSVVMAMGGGEVEIKRINRALTQMIATGKVQADEMNQLAEAGIPAWKMLADSMGLTIGQVRKLSKEGQISAQDMLKAFNDFAVNNNLGDVLEKTSQTWQAATSNIIDGLRNITAEGMEPLFNMLRDGAVAIANLLVSDQAQQFAADMKATMQDVVAAMQPVAEGVQRIWAAFKEQGATGAFSQLLTEVQNLAGQMFGAGFNVVAEYASGLMQGAGSLIVEAANFIADTIASYLIGQSPPPVGPLSAIAEGGQALIEAYIDGMRAGAQEIGDVAIGIQDALGNINETMTLASGREAFAQAGTDVNALKSALEDVDGVLRTMNDVIETNQQVLKDYQNAATDIKDAYDAAIAPLQQQLDLLKETNDVAQKQADIQTKIQMAQLKGALQRAQGDPVQRAQLEMRLDVLQQQEKDIQLQERALSLTKQSSDIQTKDRVNQLKDAAAAAKKAGDTEKAKKLTEEAAALTRGSTAQSAQQNTLAQQRLRIEQEQNQLQQQINGMVDKEAVARIKGQQAQVQAVKNQRDINEEIADLNRELAAAPLEAQIKDLKQQQEALLAPIQERIKETQREGQALQDQRQAWQGLRTDIQDVLQAQREKAAEEKKAAAETKKAAKDAAAGEETDVGAVFGTKKIAGAAAKVGKSFATGVGSWLQANGPQLIGGAVGAMLGGAVFGPIGALAGSIFGKAFVARMQEHFGSLENLGGLIAGKISDGLNIDTGGANNAAEAFGIIFETMKERALTALEALRVGIIEKLQGAQETLAGWQGKWQEAFGDESAGAKAGIAAIDGINKALQAMQLLMEGDVKGAIDTLKESFSQFGVAGSEGVNQVNTSFATLKSTLEPLVPVVAGLGAAFVAFRTIMTVVAGVTALTTAWAGFTAIASSSGGVVGAIIAILGGPLTVAVLAVAAVIGVLTAAWVGNWFGIQEATFTVIDAITSAYTTFTTWLPQATTDAMTTLQGIYTEGTTLIQGVWETMTGIIPGILTAMWNILTPENQAKLQELQTVTQEAWDAIQAIWDTVTAAILTKLGEWWAQILDAMSKAWEQIKTYWNSRVEGILEIWNKLWTQILAVTTTQFNALGKLWEGAKDTIGPIAQSLGTYLMEALEKGINAVAGKVIDAVVGTVRKALEGARGLLNMFSSESGSGSGTGMTNMSYVTGGSKASPGLQGIINKMAEKYRLDAKLFTAQLQHESAGFDPNVISGARKGGSGELGLGQFMPGTLKAMLERNNLTLQQYLGNAEVQVELAAQHMEELLKTFGDYGKALQAYNGGPGGVGSAATQKYEQIVRSVADTLQAENRSGAGSGMQMLSTGRMTMGKNQIQAGMEAGLSMDEAQAICGPYAAVLFAQATGKNPSLAEAKQLATAVGWTAARGMGGTGNFMSLLGKMGIQAVRQAATSENINAALAAGNPIALSTPRHYFVGSGGTAQGGINVGATGSVMSRYGGTANMTLEQITAVGGGMNDLIVLTQKLEAQGQQTFNNLTTVTGQFGDALNTGVEGVEAGMEGAAAQSADTQAQIATTTQTLTQHIQGGLVPAGLAARDAIGGMAVGIQPLISAWANGEMSSSQLAESIVQLSAQTGLATAPLEAFKAGNVSVGEALRQVMTSLAATDPAFAQIQESMVAAGFSTEQLADVLLRGLSNVTGVVGPSLAAMATAVTPLQTSFASGAISSEQLVQSIVELAATSGLTQAPLRQMQDGVLTSGQAFGQVVSQLAETNPGLQELAANIQAGNAPIEEQAAMFLEWVKAQGEASKATQENLATIEQVPESVGDIAAPMEEASTTTMQTLPEATTTSIDATLEAIRGAADPAREAATEVGNAIVEGMRSAVEAGAESIADAAKAIVEKALEAAKKAADAVKKGSSKGDNDGGDSDEKAKGGRMNPGVWTLVGEEGPELISPNGYVYTAEESRQMALNGINAGLFTLRTMAKGGKTKSSSKKSKGNKDSGAPWLTEAPKPDKITTPVSGPEYDTQTEILRLTLKINEEKLKGLPIENALKAAQKAQEEAAKGTFEQQLLIGHQKRLIANVDAAIAEIRFKDTATQESMYNMEVRLSRLKAAQEQGAKGSLEVQLQLNDLEGQRLQHEQTLAKIQIQALPAQHELANLQAQIAEIQAGSVEDQLKVADIRKQQTQNQIQMNNLELAAAPLRQEEAALQADIQKILEGTTEQKALQLRLQTQTAELELQSLQVQAQMLPLQKQISDIEANVAAVQRGSLAVQYEAIDVQTQTAKLDIEALGINKQLRDINVSQLAIQNQIDDVQRGSLDDQYAAIDAQTKNAQLRTQELQINQQLRKVNAGTLDLSQEQINSLHKQLEVIEDQKADISDTNELKELQATISTADAQKQLASLGQQQRAHETAIASLDYQKDILGDQTTLRDLQAQIAVADAQKQLAALNEQLLVHQNVANGLDYQKQILGNQTGQITTQNQVSAAGQQERLLQVQGQLAVFTAQITQLQAQNTVLDLQAQNIDLANTARAQGLSAQLIMLQTQVGEYNKQITAVQQQNALVQAQSALLTANNAVAAHGHQAAILTLENSIALRNTELLRLEAEKGYLEGQITLVQTQNLASAAMHNDTIIRLQAQKTLQDNILEDMNAQLGTLNAQKAVYESIRNLADQIANRPVNPPGAPQSPTGGPPGTVAATATKEGSQTLYLSRGTGTDGWYTSGGQLVVAGGTAQPPSGYRVKWLAAGGAWHAGEMAVVGENGPEIAIAQRDMHVFPHEQSTRIARAFGVSGGGDGLGSGGSGKQVTVNLEYHRHGGTDYGQGTLVQVVREAVNAALRS